MLVLSFALLGLIAGLGLDVLIVHLAVPPDDGLTGGEEAVHTQTIAAESGSLVVTSVGAQWPRRLIVMAATAGLFAIAAVRYDEPAQLALVSVYICVFVACAGTDLLAYRVPNVITYPAIIGAVVVGALMPNANVWEVLAGGALTGSVLLLPALFTGGIGMGMGDVKLAAFVGLAIGFTLAPAAMLIMAFSGGLIAALLLVTGLRQKGEPIPYAPFISAGGLIVLLWQGAAFATVA